jgi:hypothetical protein
VASHARTPRPPQAPPSAAAKNPLGAAGLSAVIGYATATLVRVLAYGVLAVLAATLALLKARRSVLRRLLLHACACACCCGAAAAATACASAPITDTSLGTCVAALTRAHARAVAGDAGVHHSQLGRGARVARRPEQAAGASALGCAHRSSRTACKTLPGRKRFCAKTHVAPQHAPETPARRQDVNGDGKIDASDVHHALVRKRCTCPHAAHALRVRFRATPAHLRHPRALPVV